VSTMPIEVRQLLIKSTVNPSREAPASGTAAEPPVVWRERLREELLAECKAWVEDRLQKARER